MDVALRAGPVGTPGVVPTFASAGLEHRAAAISSIAGSSWDFLAGLLDHLPLVKVPRSVRGRLAGELFANLALHARVPERALASLQPLTTLPGLAALTSGREFEHRSRDAVERHDGSIGDPNDVWYQFRPQVAAAELYDRLAETAIPRLFDAFRIDGGTDRQFRGFDESIDDATLAGRLAAAGYPSLGAFSLAF